MRIHRPVALALARGEVVGLASILEVEGSAPAPEGARLARFAGGDCLGTIGGGAPEKAAVNALAAGFAGIREFDLAGGGQEPGLLCGGRIRVLFEQLGPESSAVFTAIADGLARGEPVVSGILVADGVAATRKVTAGGVAVPPGAHPLDAALGRAGESGERQRQVVAEGGEAHVEVLRQTPRLVVIGGGHVGKAAAEIAHAAGFRVAVIDDRPEYVSAGRFPAAEASIAARPAAGLAEAAIGPADAILVATRSAELDLEGVTAAARSPAFYVGLLASKRKWASLQPQVAAAAGAAAAARVRAPVGLGIGAVGPGEIAVAIVAEVVSGWRTRDLLRG
jgi:xanthine dehydrogenase accessory factor